MREQEIAFEIIEDPDGRMGFDIPMAVLVRILIDGYGHDLGRKATKALDQLAKRLEAAA